MNPVKIDESNRPKIAVYSGDHVFSQPAPDTIEQPGSFYFPLLGALITSGGRLLRAMIERCVRDAGGTYLCCDTDALIIVASKTGGTVQMPESASPAKPLSWTQVEHDRYNELKLQVLALFASTQGEWLGPNEAAEKLNFFPARSAWTYLKRLWRFGLLERRSRWSGIVGIQDQRLGKDAASLAAFAAPSNERMGVSGTRQLPVARPVR